MRNEDLLNSDLNFDPEYYLDNTPMSGHVVSYQATINGKRYHGRGSGEGMLLNLRPSRGRR